MHGQKSQCFGLMILPMHCLLHDSAIDLKYLKVFLDIPAFPQQSPSSRWMLFSIHKEKYAMESKMESTKTCYVLTGSLSPKLELNEEGARTICHAFASFLHQKGYREFDVRTGYRQPDGVWRILVVLFRPLEEMASLMELNNIHDEFTHYILWNTLWFRWVEELADCSGIIPGWEEWGMGH